MLHVKKKGEKLLIRFVGELDGSSALEMERILKEYVAQGCRQIDIDFRYTRHFHPFGVAIAGRALAGLQQEKLRLHVYGLTKVEVQLFRTFGDMEGLDFPCFSVKPD